MKTLTRDEWNGLCDELTTESFDSDVKVTMRGGEQPSVGLEYGEGLSDVDVYFSRRATDIRVGDLQLIATHGRVILLRAQPPYPIEKWSVIYDGELPRL